MTDQPHDASTAHRPGPRVIKLGGSLLERATWPDDFRRWLAAQPPANNILIVGGGTLVDAIRRFDDVHDLSASNAHWLAIAAMSVTAKLAKALLPEAEWTDEWPTVREFANSADIDSQLLIFDVGRFLETVEPTFPGPLSQSWDVTSDSIAARIAALLGAHELVLLKSCASGELAGSLDAAAKAEYVDRAFPHSARQLRRVALVDLPRSP